MEAVPRLYMLSCDLKISPTNAEFATPLKKYIRDFYHENPESYDKEIKEVEALRNAMCKVPHDFTGCSTLKRYFSQLNLLQNRFPMTDDGPACVPFTWSDIYSGATVSITDVKYEQACVLYNIGALHSQLGAMDTRSNVEGMKMACTHFQCAAWAFQHLRDTYPQPKGSDMSHDVLTYMMNVMLAQAQECILEKSMLDNRKSSITAKVAAQVVDYYIGAHGILVSNTPSNSSISDIVGSKTYKAWRKYIEFKMAYYMSISQFFMGIHSEEQQKMGERVAYFQAASEQLNEAIKQSKNMDKENLNEPLSFLVDVINGKFNNSKKENDFVYHEKVPPINMLPELKGASLVKGIPFNPMDPDVCGPDIFVRLVPMETHSYSSMYSEEKAKILRAVLSKIEGKDEELSTFMSSLQLDRNIFKDEPETIPQELLEKCAAMSVKPTAVSDITELMSELMDTSKNVEASLALCSDLLSEEELKEAKHQVLFGKRVPSMITVELKKERSKLEEAHKKASESNKTLQNAASAHIDNLRVLAGPVEDVKRKLSSEESENFMRENSQAVVDFLKLLNKVDEMQDQRQALAQQLREAVHSDDITKRLVALDNKAEVEKVFQEELRKHDRCLSYIEQNLTAQDNILFALTQANAGFADVRKSILAKRNNREMVISSLIASYEAYEDLMEKGNKGLEFYQKLKTSVSKLLDRIRSVTRVQDEERSQRASTDKHNSVPLPDAPSPVQASAGPTLKQYLPYLAGSKVPSLPPQTKIPPVPPNASYPIAHGTPSTYPATYNTNQPKIPPDQNLPSQYVPVSRPQSYQNPAAQLSYGTYNNSVTSHEPPQYVPPVAPVSQQYDHFKPPFSETNRNFTMPYPQYSNVKSMSNDPKMPFVSNMAVSMSQTEPYVSMNVAPPSMPTVSQASLPYPPTQTSIHHFVPSSESSYLPGNNYKYPNTNLASQHPYAAGPSAVPPYHQNEGSSSSIPTDLNAGQTVETYSFGTCIPHPGIATNNPYPYSNSVPAKYPPTNKNFNTVPAYSGYETPYSSNSNISGSFQNNSGNYVPQVMPSNNPQPYVNTPSMAAQPVAQQYNSSYQYQNPETSFSNTYAYSPSYPTVSQTTSYPTASQTTSYPTVSQTTSYPTVSQTNNVVSTTNYPQVITNIERKPMYFSDSNSSIGPSPVPASGTNSSSQMYLNNQMQYYPSENKIAEFQNPHRTSVLETTPHISQEPLQPQTVNIGKKIVPKESNVLPSDNTLKSEKKKDHSPHLDKNGKSYLGDNVVGNVPSAINNRVQLSDLNEQKDLKIQPSKEIMLNIPKSKLSEDSETKDPFSDLSVQTKFIAEVEKYEKLVDGLVRMSLNGTTPLDQKWKELMDTQEKESRKMSISVARCYPLKNRVPDIMPYDSNRVKLASSKDDYINASYMKDLLPSSPVFVISQAPLPSTFCDFWLMVWEQQVETLVCLLPPNEIKNHIYWPKERTAPVTHGIFDLTLQSQKENDSFAERIISIHHNKNKTSRVVIHLQFKTWHSSKSPEISTLLTFTSTALNYYSQQRSLLRPMVVHCSSGVSRSGTFCLIAALVSEMNKGHGPRDVSSVAARMCTQRKFIIQEKDQFKFCYDVALFYADSCLKKRGLGLRKRSFDDKAASLVHSTSQSENDIAKLQSSILNLGISSNARFFTQPAASDSNVPNNEKSSIPVSSPSKDSLAEPQKHLASEDNAEIGDGDNDTAPSCINQSNQVREETSNEVSVPETLSEVSAVSSILDPNNFRLDPQDTPSKRRITKDAFIQSTGVLSRMSTDNSDPLSSLDPLWSLKKM